MQPRPLVTTMRQSDLRRCVRIEREVGDVAGRFDNKELLALLNKLDACQRAVRWVGDRDLARTWEECERGDWLLWLAGRMVGKEGWPTHQQVVLAACACARRGLRFVPEGEERPLRAIEAAEHWATVPDAAWAAGAVWAAAGAVWAAEHRALADIVRATLPAPTPLPPATSAL